MSIVLTGSLAIDRIMNFPGVFKEHILADKIHALNVSFNIGQYEERRGGTAGNIAYTLTLLGEQPIIVAAVGRDFDEYRQYVNQLGLSTDHIEHHDDLVTASAHIITDQDDNQITGFIMGAMAQETHFDLSSLENPQKCWLVLSPGNKQDMLRYAVDGKRLNIPVIFDPGQTLPFLEPQEIQTLIQHASIVIVNDYELEMIKNRTGLTPSQIVDQGACLIVTVGKQGSTIETKNGRVAIPVCSVPNAVDPTGAGDAYRAGLLKGLCHSMSVEVAARIGSVAASYAVEQYGTQEHRFTMDEFTARYTQTFGSPFPL